jgi:cytosine deaminase
VVIGENINFQGEELLLHERGIQLCLLNDPETIEMMTTFIEKNNSLWNEDIGEPC